MEFRDAMRLLGQRVTQEDVADKLGVSHHTIRQAVLPESRQGYRKPPQGWQELFVRLARERAAELHRLADELEREEEKKIA